MRAEATRRVDGNFSATLLAMAGHDLRQPLQLTTNAHDVLGGLLRERGQREELGRADTSALVFLGSAFGNATQRIRLLFSQRQCLGQGSLQFCWTL